MAYGTYTTTSNMLNAYYVPGTVLNFFILFIYLFSAALGLCCCTGFLQMW